MSRRAGKALCKALRYFLKISLSFSALPIKPSPLNGQQGVHRLTGAGMLLARLVSGGDGLVSCHQAGCMPRCHLCPREGFNLGLFCCYPVWSGSLRELNYLWEVFSLCQLCWEPTDWVLWEGLAMQLHLISIGNQETKRSGLFMLIVCPLGWSALKSHAEIGDLRHYSFSRASCLYLRSLWMSPRWLYFQV